jgi:DNA ligase (NAD+)
VQKLDDEVVRRCVNQYCPAILEGAIKHFVSRKALNVEKLGDKLVEALIARGWIKKFSDLYSLRRDQLLSLDRQGEKSVDHILKNLEKSRKTELHRLIFGLGIRFIGEQTAKNICRKFATLRDFLQALPEDLLKVEEIGPKILQSIEAWRHSNAQVEDALNLAEKILEVSNSLYKAPSTGPDSLEDMPFSGQTIVLTGTLPYPREQIAETLEALGAKISSSVSKKTSFVLAGEEAGSKLKKAQELDIKVYDWATFCEVYPGIKFTS